MDGILIIDKPAGPTSHDVVQIVKRLTGANKVGHLGTLDPAATGVLPLVLNGATKRAAELAGIEKVYEFDLCLGVTTDSDDDTGKVLEEQSVSNDLQSTLKVELEEFIGNILQRPPQFSAIKVGGKRAYKSARKGFDPRLEPRPIHIDSIEIVGGKWPRLRLRVECRSGTYVRSLARDIGEKLGCGGHAAEIRRFRSGKWRIEDAVSLDALQEKPACWKDALILLDG